MCRQIRERNHKNVKLTGIRWKVREKDRTRVLLPWPKAMAFNMAFGEFRGKTLSTDPLVQPGGQLSMQEIYGILEDRTLNLLDHPSRRMERSSCT